MKHLICQVVDFEIVAPALFGWDGPLKDLQLFNQVAIDSEVHTLVWPNGADFDPATLHDWPECSQEFADMVRTWEHAHADTSV